MSLNCIIETEKRYVLFKKKISLDDVQNDKMNRELTEVYIKTNLFLNISLFYDHHYPREVFFTHIAYYPFDRRDCLKPFNIVF